MINDENFTVKLYKDINIFIRFVTYYPVVNNEAFIVKLYKKYKYFYSFIIHYHMINDEDFALKQYTKYKYCKKSYREHTYIFMIIGNAWI